MLHQPRGHHVPSSPSTTGGWLHLAAVPRTPLKPSGRRSSIPPAAASPPSPSPSPQHVHGQQQAERLCYMPEPWSRHTTTQIPTTPLIPALPSPPHLLLPLAAFCAFWFFKWAQAGASATHPDQHPAANPAPPSGPQVTPAMRWASLQLQQQGWQKAAAAAPPSTPQHEPTTISQLICCIRTPTAAPSSQSSSAAADAIRRAVQHYSCAPGAPAITGLTVTYPTCALMVLEGDTSSLCAVLRELLQPAPSAPLTSSSSSPLPLGLSPRDARAVSFNPESDIRQFSDWYEAHVNVPLNPKLPMDRSLARVGRQPGGVMSGLGMPGVGGGMPGMGAIGQGMPGIGGGTGMPGMGMLGMGGGGMAGGATAAGMPPVKAVLSDSEFLEAAEAVALFVSLVSTKLEGLPGYSQREELLKGLAREFTLPEPQVITSLAATEAVPTLPQFLEQFDIEYVRYATLALSDNGQHLLEAAIAADDGLIRDGAAAADRTGLEEGPAADPAAREVQRLRFLYHRHLTLQLQEAVRSSSLDTRESPLAKYYPKPKP